MRTILDPLRLAAAITAGAVVGAATFAVAAAAGVVGWVRARA